MCVSLSVFYTYATWLNPDTFLGNLVKFTGFKLLYAPIGYEKKPSLWKQDQPTPVVISALKKVRCWTSTKHHLEFTRPGPRMESTDCPVSVVCM